MSQTSSPTPAPYVPETQLLSEHDIIKTPSSDNVSITDLIKQTSPPFDHQSLVADPYNEEEQKEADFCKKFTEMFMKLMIKCHAWASRPAFENAKHAADFQRRIYDVMQVETDQGMSINRDIMLAPSLLAIMTGSFPFVPCYQSSVSCVTF
jgi:hypothetical protein